MCGALGTSTWAGHPHHALPEKVRYLDKVVEYNFLRIGSVTGARTGRGPRSVLSVRESGTEYEKDKISRTIQ